MDKLKSTAKSLYARVRYALCYDIHIINRTAQTCFFFGLAGIAGWGTCVTIPFLYSNADYRIGKAVQAFGFFMAIQLAVNWLCIKFVDSTYQPSVHGTIPDDMKIGQNVSKRRELKGLGSSNGDNNNGVRSRKGASKMGSVIYVATELPKAGETTPKRTSYQYFSWTPCLRCNRPRPPRCHHCTSCDKCVLKRDHHCFFVDACVGYRNLRHFSVFIFWASMSTLFGTIHALPYYYYEVVPYVRFYDWVFPVSIVRAVFGYVQIQHSFLIVIAWVLVAFDFWSFAFMFQCFTWVTSGSTSFEEQHKIIIEDSRPLSGRLKAVFGHFWALNFIVPLHFIFEPIDDPVKWPSMRA